MGGDDTHIKQTISGGIGVAQGNVHQGDVYNGKTVPKLADLLVAGIARLPRGTITPSQLLIARHRVVPFAGRVAELAELDRWADDDAEVAVRLIHADGGAGKTRLAQEWIGRRKEAGKRAGFLPGELTDDVIASVGAAHDADIVLDYAESRAELAALMASLARRRLGEEPGRIRVVLLSRNAGDWWQVLKQSSDDIADLLADSPAALSLAPLVEPAQRGAEFTRALAAFGAKFQGSRALTQGYDWIEAGGIPDLSDPRFGRTLYLHAAALMTGLGEQVTAGDVLDRVLDHETRIWLRRGKFDDRTSDAAQVFKAAAQGVIAAVTLRGGVADKAGLEALTAHVAGAGHGHLARMVAQLYPGEGADFTAPLEPDLLGETLVVRTLESREHGLAWLERATTDLSASWATVFTVLGRAEVHGPEVVRVAEVHLLSNDLATRAVPALDALLALATQTAHAGLGQVLAEALKERGNLAIARNLVEHLPARSVMLREVSLWAAEKIANHADDNLERGVALADLSGCLTAMGQWTQAIVAAREALEIFSASEELLPSYIFALACAQTNLGLAQGQSGEPAEAELSTRAAIEVLNELESPVVRFRLAQAQTNLGTWLNRLERWPEALGATEEAISIFEEPAVRSLDPEEAGLAMAATNLGVIYSHLGQRSEALVASVKAVEIRRRQAAARPDAYMPDLAHALVNLGTRLSAEGATKRALLVVGDAAAIFSRLAAQRPSAFGYLHARALHNLGRALSAADRLDEARIAAQSAVEIHRKLANSESTALLADFVIALGGLTSHQTKLEEFDAAISTSEEAVCVSRRLAELRPESFLEDLIRCLGSHGKVLAEGGRIDEASDAFAEAVRLVIPLVEDAPSAFGELALQLLLDCHDVGGQDLVAEEVERFVKSVPLFQTSSSQHPASGPAERQRVAQLPGMKE